jgi:hypothetical protein
MTTTLPSWSDRANHAIARLAARPWSLFLVLLAVSALARPYAGITLDARLYSAQVLNRLDSGTYGDDLFFRYGSQDQFSIFSWCVAPVVHLLGLQPAFFLLYFLFNSLLILGLKRLVETLIEDRLVSTLALVFMMVVPLHFGGLKALGVQESFLTARLVANALVLLGLEQTVRQRYCPALVLLVLGLAFHPLMAIGGLAIWAGSCAWNLLPGKILVFLVLVLGLASVLVLSNFTVGSALFGTMDESWREVVRRATPFNFVSEWYVEDWLNVGMGLIGVGAAAVACWKGNVVHGRFLLLVTIVSVAAVVGTALAESLPYALLVQGQPYRALWILKVLQVPFAFWFAVRLFGVPQWYGPLGAVTLIGFLCLTTGLALEWCLPLFLLPVFMLGYRGLERAPSRPDWWRRSLATSLVLGFLGWTLYKLSILLANHTRLMSRVDTLDYGRLLIDNIGPMSWLVLFVLFAGWTARRSNFARGFQGAVLAVLLVAQGAMALLQASPSFRENHTRYGKDILFVREFLSRRHAPAVPTIYSCLGKLDLVWLDLHAKCYFDWWQLSGVIFQRQTAMEGQRRALVVGTFEMDRFREVGEVSEFIRKQASRFFDLDFDTANPELGNLKELCQEEGVDFLLLTHEFPGLVTAGNGRIFIYDCRQVRAALIHSSPTADALQTVPTLTCEDRR